MAVGAALRDTFPGDLFLTHRWQDVDAPALGGTLDFVNALGDAWPVTAIALAALAALALSRRWWEATLLVLAFPPRVLVWAIKELVGRPRPDEGLVRVTEEASSSGFVSGHAVGAVLFYGLLLYLAPRLLESRPLRALLRLFCVFMIVMAGPARVYTGAHWPSDVVGGYLLGALVLALLVAADSGARRLSRPPA